MSGILTFIVALYFLLLILFAFYELYRRQYPKASFDARYVRFLDFAVVLNDKCETQSPYLNASTSKFSLLMYSSSSITRFYGCRGVHPRVLLTIFLGIEAGLLLVPILTNCTWPGTFLLTILVDLNRSLTEGQIVQKAFGAIPSSK